MNNAILFVDDTRESLRLLTDILIAEGYNVRPADSGMLALASAKANPPELILLDIRMPGIDGYEVCRQLKQSKGGCWEQSISSPSPISEKSCLSASELTSISRVFIRVSNDWCRS